MFITSSASYATCKLLQQHEPRLLRC